MVEKSKKSESRDFQEAGKGIKKAELARAWVLDARKKPKEPKTCGPVGRGAIEGTWEFTKGLDTQGLAEYE